LKHLLLMVSELKILECAFVTLSDEEDAASDGNNYGNGEADEEEGGEDGEPESADEKEEEEDLGNE
jgi:hypothetical protein